MSWKNYYQFTSGEKKGIIVLIVLIVLTRLLIWSVPLLFPPKLTDKDAQQLAMQVAAFKASIKEVEEKKRKRRWQKFPSYTSLTQTTHTLFPFDPNTADQETFVQLGIKSYIAQNIIKYRAKGGKFKKATDFAKIYGIAPTQYDQLAPYIRIAPTHIERDTTSPIITTELTLPSPTEELPTAPPLIIELNTADTTALIALKGVGKYTANQIIYYRTQLGGFYDINQLMEIKGMRTKNFERIKPHLTIDPNAIHPININKASVEQLRRHPYIKYFTKAKALYDYRRKKIKLHSIEQLYVLEEFTKEEIDKLQPYLTFDQ